MLSIEECRTILGPRAEGMNDKDVEALRDLLYMIGYFDYHRHNDQDENSRDIHPRLDRRAGEERV